MVPPERHTRDAGSFRDPSGFVFSRDAVLYRQIDRLGRENYDRLVTSGLYEALVRDGLLIPHTEVDLKHAVSEAAYKVIEPLRVPFTSYPYEWCFSQLKHAALLTLQVQDRALEFGMSLKDASAYNVQFLNGKPVLIDTLSFETYREGQPWVAYRQFCQHFLAPLALVSHVDARLQQLLLAYPDGIPLDLASSMLPWRTWIGFALAAHLHLHARAQRRFAGAALPARRGSMGRTAFLGLVDSLRRAVDRLRWKPSRTEWQDYYGISSYSPAAMDHKRQLVAEFLDAVQPIPTSVWDIGANTGRFSRLASERGILTLALDKDAAAVESAYLESVARDERKLLPLVLDLTNPSPGLGWENRERASLLERGPAGVVLALAIVHHLAIANNVPLSRVAGFLTRMCEWLIIEFVPKDDPQVQRLLSNREDIFGGYGQGSFEREFGEFFDVMRRQTIADTQRTLYLMVRRSDCPQR